MKDKTLISIQLTKELLQAIKKQADSKSLTVSAYLRLLAIKDIESKNGKE